VAFADWTFYESHAAHLCAIDGAAPLVGTGSLQINNHADNGQNSVTHGYYTANKGFTRGRIRTLLQLTAVGGLPDAYAGIVCMQSQTDMSSTTGSAYMGLLGISNQGLGQLRYWGKLFKTTGGFLGSWTTLATSTNTSLFTAGTTVAVQLEWVADSAVLGGVRLILSFGSQTDFSDLAEICDYTDTSSPLSTAAAEGLMFRKIGTFGDNAEARFDQTTVVQMA
jgi:hypothetical protein